MYLLNNVKINHIAQRTIGDTQYPADWFLDPLERDKVGMTEVPDPDKPDENLFTVMENPDGSYTATPRTAADLAERSATNTATLAANAREERDKLLAATDWVVLRAKELGQAVPLDVFEYRGDLRQLPEQVGFPETITWPTEIEV